MVKLLEIATLDDGKYYDKDAVLLHAAFQLLVDYVDKEKPAEEASIGSIRRKQGTPGVKSNRSIAGGQKSAPRGVTRSYHLPDELQQPDDFEGYQDTEDGGRS